MTGITPASLAEAGAQARLEPSRSEGGSHDVRVAAGAGAA